MFGVSWHFGALTIGSRSDSFLQWLFFFCRLIISVFNLLLYFKDKFCVTILFCKHYFSSLNTFMRKGKDTDPYLYLWLTDPEGPKPCLSGSTTPVKSLCVTGTRGSWWRGPAQACPEDPGLHARVWRDNHTRRGGQGTHWGGRRGKKLVYFEKADVFDCRRIYEGDFFARYRDARIVSLRYCS